MKSEYSSLEWSGGLYVASIRYFDFLRLISINIASIPSFFLNDFNASRDILSNIYNIVLPSWTFLILVVKFLFPGM